MSKNIATDIGIACAGQSKSTTTLFKIELYEYTGTLHARWDNDSEMRPQDAQLCVMAGDQVRGEPYTLGARKGEHDFKLPHGRGFRLVLRAKNFSGQWVEVLTTAVSGEDMPPPATKKYVFSVSIENSGNRARLKWESDAAFRPHQSQYMLHVEREQKWDWLEEAKGSKRFDDVRWGVGLAGAYTAENYQGQRFDLVRTPVTKP